MVDIVSPMAFPNVAAAFASVSAADALFALVKPSAVDSNWTLKSIFTLADVTVSVTALESTANEVAMPSFTVVFFASSKSETSPATVNAEVRMIL